MLFSIIKFIKSKPFVSEREKSKMVTFSFVYATSLSKEGLENS